MMLKEKSSPWARLKYLYVLPLAAIAVTAFARPEVSKELDEILSVKVNDLTAIVKADEVKSIESQPGEEFLLKGKVKEAATNQPIVGANIIIKGTTGGTISDLDGNFAITMPVGGTLVFSYVNCKTKEVKIPSADTQGIVIVLEAEEGKTLPKHVPVEPSVPQDEVFRIVEEMPEFPGGMGECLKFLESNVRYPKVAHDNGVQGKVIVQFIVEKDGSVTNPQVVRSVDSYLDTEALRVIMLMPKWKPGMQRGQSVRVKYTIPVAFRLTGGKEEPKDTTMATIELRMNKNGVGGLHIVDGVKLYGLVGNEQPLILVDGEEAGRQAIEKLPHDKIEGIAVLKDDASTAVYGTKGKNGVILITTKKEITQ